ncbi:hypothetical protein EB796_009437 [Bugula neritina]|uniref:Uncharacterized protein n=1 Tax=Bugula neritina TaxID=10212 RepID=A0A7J7K2R6_BUGNE|nr:hypothetical protein EB796_009437 [Bugula neritina]
MSEVNSGDAPTGEVNVKSEKELKKEAAKAAKLAKFQAKQSKQKTESATTTEVSVYTCPGYLQVSDMLCVVRCLQVSVLLYCQAPDEWEGDTVCTRM